MTASFQPACAANALHQGMLDVFVPFLYGDSQAELRRKNLQQVDAEVAAYTGEWAELPSAARWRRHNLPASA